MGRQNGAQEQQQYTFRNTGWPIGEQPSFEVDLVTSDGSDHDDVTKCIKVIQQLPSDDQKMKVVSANSPKLHRRIVRQDISRLIPNPTSGMSAGSVRYVIKHVYGTVDVSPDMQPHDSHFLRWLTQICITLWVYQCNRNVVEEVEEGIRSFIISNDFRLLENAAAYLTIIAFVLGGPLDDKLLEFVDAVVWCSKTEFGPTMGPLRRVINRERLALLEHIFGMFSWVLNGLFTSQDAQLMALAQRLSNRFKSLTNFQLDFNATFASTQQLDCAKYPAMLEAIFFEALHAERRSLRSRTRSFGSSHSDTSGRAVQRQGSTRDGSGVVWVTHKVHSFSASFGAIFSKSKQEIPQTPGALADRLDIIIDESRDEIKQRRERIADAVQELIGARDPRFDEDSSVEEDSDMYTGDGSFGGSSS